MVTRAAADATMKVMSHFVLLLYPFGFSTSAMRASWLNSPLLCDLATTELFVKFPRIFDTWILSSKLFLGDVEDEDVGDT